jgi:hypothetical protein
MISGPAAFLASFNTLANTQNQETTTPTEKPSRMISFIDKHNGFSSLSPIDEKIFREILSDDKFTMEEANSLSYEQMQKIDKFLLGGDTTNVSADEIPIVNVTDNKIGAMLKATMMTDNTDFNKSLFKTVQTIDNNIERMDFFDRLSDSLGFNDNTEATRAIIARTNDTELKKKYLPQDDNWKINDYSKFITANISELNAILKNPVYDEDKPMYQKLLNNFTTLGKNYSEISNKSKYI